MSKYIKRLQCFTDEVSALMVFVLLMSLLSGGCKKYLDKKSDQSLSTPSTLAELQGLMDEPRMNTALDVINTSTDEYYVTNDDWLSTGEVSKDAYVWDAKLDNPDDWKRQYITIFYANTALDNLSNVANKGQISLANNIKGSALFFRAYSFYQLLQLFAVQYDPATAAKDLGIPLRLNSNFNEPSMRASVEQSYAQIIKDLTTAIDLLPDVPLHKTRPSKPACFAQLARTYLQMGNYTMAKENSDKCLQLYSSLLDFNDQQEVDSMSSAPISLFNKEVIFFTYTGSCLNATAAARIDSNLYKSYQDNDLRKKVFFSDNGDHTYRFIGSYNSGAENLFNGLATDEVLLIRAESNARLGNKDAAMADLNLLLQKRWRTGSFTPLTATSSFDAVQKILIERKKELIYRGTRWPDIKRLNKESSLPINLKRILDGNIYELKPNDSRFALLIPEEIIQQSNMAQNPR